MVSALLSPVASSPFTASAVVLFLSSSLRAAFSATASAYLTFNPSSSLIAAGPKAVVVERVGTGVGAFFVASALDLATPLEALDRAPSGLLTSPRPTESLLIVSLEEMEGLERCVDVLEAGSLVALEVVVLRAAADDDVGTAGFFFSGVPGVTRDELVPIVETRLLATVDVVDPAVRELVLL